MNGGVVVIVVGILSLILAILSVIFITPRSKKPYLSGFSLWLHQLFNFDVLLIDKILKFFYIFSTAAVILFGFAMLFYIGYIGGEALLISLGLILLGPIVIRLLYEGIMLMVILVRNVAEINNKLPEAAGTGKSAPAAASPAKTTPVTPTCPVCGGRLKPGARFCGSCGTNIASAASPTPPAASNNNFQAPGDDDLS